MPKSPQISVLMSAYNSRDHVREAIRSILDQTFSDFEFVIVNDGSADSTLSIISEFKDPRILIQNISHSGLTKALNSGLQIARGEFVARMDADDIAQPNRLKLQFEFLQANPDIAVVGAGYEVLCEDGSRKASTVPLLATDYEIKKALPRFNPFMHGSVMIRKHALLDAGLYDEGFLLAQDYDLWFRLSKKYKFANLNKILMLRREDKQTLEKERKQNYYAVKARLKAISEGNLNWGNLIFLFRPILVILTPVWLKQLIRKMIHRSNG